MSDEIFMARAIELARSVPFTSPNPRVGCVVVRDGSIVSQGAHEGAGRPHAEVVALDGILAEGTTVFVTLEPCNHHGRTPPCAPALIAAGVRRVVVAMEDPDPRVAGQGIDALQQAGIEVEVGVLEAEARSLTAPYIYHRSTGSAFLTVKLATSLDGSMASADGTSRWITSPETRRFVHQRRREADAVMVGSGTVLKDDPELTVRHVEPSRHPVRVILDSRGRVSPEAKVFTGSGEVIVATTADCPHEKHMAFKQAGAEVMVLPSTDGGLDAAALMAMLGARGMLEVYCEGGPILAASLLREGLVNRLELHLGPVLLGAEGLRLEGLGIGSLDEAMRWQIRSVRRIGSDVVLTCERG